MRLLDEFYTVSTFFFWYTEGWLAGSWLRGCFFFGSMPSSSISIGHMGFFQPPFDPHFFYIQSTFGSSIRRVTSFYLSNIRNLSIKEDWFYCPFQNLTLRIFVSIDMLALSTYQNVTSFLTKSPTLERRLLAQRFGQGKHVLFYFFKLTNFVLFPVGIKGIHRKRFSLVENSASPASANPGTSYDEHRPKTPPPDLPSLLLDSRIVYIGMPVRQCSCNYHHTDFFSCSSYLLSRSW
jgi:hypothetical protein